MVKYATTLRLGTMEAEQVLRRFTRGGPKHPTYQALAEPAWAKKLTDEDRRGLTALFWSNINPYGTFRLDMRNDSILPRLSADLGRSAQGLSNAHLRGELDRVKEAVQPQAGIEVRDAM